MDSTYRTYIGIDNRLFRAFIKHSMLRNGSKLNPSLVFGNTVVLSLLEMHCIAIATKDQNHILSTLDLNISNQLIKYLDKIYFVCNYMPGLNALIPEYMFYNCNINIIGRLIRTDIIKYFKKFDISLIVDENKSKQSGNLTIFNINGKFVLT